MSRWMLQLMVGCWLRLVAVTMMILLPASETSLIPICIAVQSCTLVFKWLVVLLLISYDDDDMILKAATILC